MSCIKTILQLQERINMILNSDIFLLNKGSSVKAENFHYLSPPKQCRRKKIIRTDLVASWTLQHITLGIISIGAADLTWKLANPHANKLDAASRAHLRVIMFVSLHGTHYFTNTLQWHVSETSKFRNQYWTFMTLYPSNPHIKSHLNPHQSFFYKDPKARYVTASGNQCCNYVQKRFKNEQINLCLKQLAGTSKNFVLN
jgi:hypothetical protein